MACKMIGIDINFVVNLGAKKKTLGADIVPTKDKLTDQMEGLTIAEGEQTAEDTKETPVESKQPQERQMPLPESQPSEEPKDAG